MRIIIDTMYVQMKQTFARNMYKFCLFVQPLATTVILAEMYKKSAAGNFTAYVILGAGLMSLWVCICFSSAGDINRERYSNTLSLLFVSPSDFRLILLGKIIGNTLLSLLSFALTVLYAVILYRYKITIPNIPLCLLAFSLTIFCFIVISIFIAYLLTLSRITELYMNCLDIPITLVCGFVFPIEYLPVPVQWISYALPPTWAVRILRQSVLGDYSKFWGNVAVLLLITFLYGVAGSLLYKIIERQVKIKASLEMV